MSECLFRAQRLDVVAVSQVTSYDIDSYDDIFGSWHRVLNDWCVSIDSEHIGISKASWESGVIGILKDHNFYFVKTESAY